MPALNSERLAAAQQALEQTGILNRLVHYRPTVVSTIWIGFDTADSDIDILCHSENLQQFLTSAREHYGKESGFRAQLREDHALARFTRASFLFELYCSVLPIESQLGYRHFQVMTRLETTLGQIASDAVRKRKSCGLSTEEAIADWLQLSGDPYQAVLQLEEWSPKRIRDRVSSCQG